MLCALLIVKVIFNILSKQRVEVFVWFSPRCGDIATKNVCLHFFYSTHPVTKKLIFFFFARFYFYMYISCSLDCSIYHWKLVIHQSIKNKYSYKKNLKLIFKAKTFAYFNTCPYQLNIFHFWTKHFTKVISCYVFQSIHVLLYIYYHIVGEWGMNVAYRFILWVAVIFIERNDLLLKKSQLPSPQMTMPLNCI